MPKKSKISLNTKPISIMKTRLKPMESKILSKKDIVRIFRTFNINKPGMNNKYNRTITCLIIGRLKTIEIKRSICTAMTVAINFWIPNTFK
jgi:hypothetical protein